MSICRWNDNHGSMETRKTLIGGTLQSQIVALLKIVRGHKTLQRTNLAAEKTYHMQVDFLLEKWAVPPSVSAHDSDLY